MDLHVSLRPKESSWTIVFLEVFMLDLVNWPTHVKNMEGYLFEDGYQTRSLNSDSECAENHSECNESIDDDTLSSNCEEKNSSFSE